MYISRQNHVEYFAQKINFFYTFDMTSANFTDMWEYWDLKEF